LLIRTTMIALCCALASTAANAQAAAPPRTEQVETGFATIAGHPNTRYSIRLLPVSSFPQLPLPVTQQLERLGCMIPQTYEARAPENVISGSFEKKGSSDWAALCSVKGHTSPRGAFRSTTLYVFFQSDYTHPIALRSQPDTLWLGKEWGADYGSAWGIAAYPARLMRPRDQYDHDGIEDAFVEQSRVVHYFRDGHWTKMEGSQ